MPETEQFRAIATAMLDRRIRNMRRLDERTWIDTSLITHAEYQLFLDGMSIQYHQPDHWQEWRFPPKEAQMPVVGLRPSDAVAFCAWISRQGWGKFRIPFKNETHGLEEMLPGFWQFIGKGGESQYKGKIPPIPRANDLAHNLNQGRDRARNLAHVLNLDLAIDLALDVDLARDLAIDLDIARGLYRTRDRTRDRDFDLAIDLARDLAIDRARNCAETTTKEKLKIIISHLLILSLRREGLLPAFEGILIVREESDHA